MLTAEHKMFHHVNRDFSVIISLRESEPQSVFILDEESNEPLIDFQQYI